MADQRHKNADWKVAGPDGVVRSWECAQVALLMDIRDELQRLNDLTQRHNMLEIPDLLRRIARNTTPPVKTPEVKLKAKPKRRAAKKKAR